MMQLFLCLSLFVEVFCISFKVRFKSAFKQPQTRRSGDNVTNHTGALYTLRHKKGISICTGKSQIIGDRDAHFIHKFQ